MMTAVLIPVEEAAAPAAAPATAAAVALTATPTTVAPAATLTAALAPMICPVALTTSTAYVPAGSPANEKLPVALLVVEPASSPVWTFLSWTVTFASVTPDELEAVPESEAVSAPGAANSGAVTNNDEASVEATKRRIEHLNRKDKLIPTENNLAIV